MRASWHLLGRRVLCAMLLSGAALAAQAQITVVGTSTTPSPASSGVTSVTLNTPAGVTANDVLIANLAVRGGSGVTLGTPPPGWTLVNRTNSGTAVAQAVYVRTVAASEPASYTWTFTPGDRAAAAIVAFRGVSTTTPIDVSAGQATSPAATAIVAPSVTTTVANTMLVGLYSIAQGGEAFTAPGGMTERFDISTGAGPNGVTIAAATATQATIGASGPRTASATSSELGVGTLVALRPGCGPTFTVTNTSNSGAGSLRQAITDANACPGLNTIAFNVTGTGCVSGVCTIAPTAVLPTITDPVVIDGTTQPGFSGVPRIQIDGVSTSGVNGLQLNTTGSTIRALSIIRFGQAAILLDGAGVTGNTVAGNYLGLRADGTAAGNFEGVNLQNGAASNTIGGSTAADRNVIGSNTSDGIQLGLGSSNNIIRGNYVGLDPTGTLARGNAHDGIDIDTGAASNQVIGNVVSANSEDGIEMGGSAPDSPNNVIRGNLIGTRADGTGSLGNAGSGIRVGGASPATNLAIGGTAAGDGNTIANNTGAGVWVQSGTGVAILGNSMFSNGGLGIDLGSATGVTANDGVKSSGQPNLLMDFPVFTSTALSGTTLSVAGYVGSAANQSTFANPRVEVFIADTTAAGNGEGRTYLGFLTTDASGNFSGSIAGVSGITTGTTRITATATDASNNTSEFGPNFVVSNAAATVGGFNAFETTTASGATSGVIKTKVAGSAFSLSLVALNAGRTAVETSFTGSVTVELLDASNNSGALNATTGCRSSWTTIQCVPRRAGARHVFERRHHGDRLFDRQLRDPAGELRFAAGQ